MGLEQQRLEIGGLRLAYQTTGEGSPIVFQHGNPTSSYLWRNIMPVLASQGRCLALDLPGMGQSDPLPPDYPDRYRLSCHQKFFDEVMDQLCENQKITLVLHDWGTALGFDWARRNAERVAGLVYMEGIVCPLSWDDWPENGRELFKALRSPAGEDLILQRNVFVEKILPGSIIRSLDETEMEAYRQPFAEPGDTRAPTLAWPREIPLDNEPADVVATVEAYSQWLKQTAIPKLFINAEPGAILTGRQRELCRTFPNQKELTVRGIHFLQEDSPAEIAEAIGSFLSGLPS